MNNNHFRKVYFMDFLTTELNDKGEEKKNLLNILPKGWNKDDFDFSQPLIKNKASAKGHVVITGKGSNITVLDFDDMALYRQACELVPDLNRYYTVQTRNGMHVYFLYNESLKNSKISKIDLQTNGKLVIGQDTLLKRYNGKTFMYSFVGGKLEKMPQVLIDWCCNVKKTATSERKNYETSVNYNYEVTEDECRSILEQMVENHREYYTDYDKWITFTAIMKTLNMKEMWDEYSERYDNNNYNKYKNDNIWRGIKSKISINFFCKILGIPAMKYHKKVPEDELYNEIEYYEETTRYVNLQYVNVSYNDFISNDTVIIESGTGTGKTTCVSKLFKNLQQNEERCTILSIVNLITLANQQKITFKKSGINLTMYNDEKVNPAIIISSDACICINSLWKLSNCNFRNKIVYIDEIYALCMSLTHNETLKKQRQIFNTLYRIVKTCKKLIVSDAHIHNNVIQLLNARLFDINRTYIHYCNEYQKYSSIPAVRYNDENKFYELLEGKVLTGINFSFACDSKSILTKWYTKLYSTASVDVQSRMFLYTADEDTEIHTDWNDKIIFYSPKITTGVDITCINSSEQFMYITGQSVSSINLLQMATRTRNMNQLNYYSSARSCESLYENFEDCKKKLTDKYLTNEFGFDYDDIEEFLENEDKLRNTELIHLNMYIRNSYVLDLHNTNILYFFEQELKSCGFNIQQSVGTRTHLDKKVTSEFKELTQKNREDKYDMLLESFNETENTISVSIAQMKERCQLLNLSTVEEVTEYRELVEDSSVLEHFFNYNGLKKTLDYCESKVRDTVNNKMLAGVEKTRWFKIKYVHILAKLCGISESLFDIESIIMPKLDEKNKKLIKSIKVLYKKRDAVEVDEYDLDSLKQLYKFMIDSLTKKLKLYSSVRNRTRGEDYNNTSVKRNEDLFEKYDRLVKIMNPQSEDEYNFESDEE